MIRLGKALLRSAAQRRAAGDKVRAPSVRRKAARGRAGPVTLGLATVALALAGAASQVGCTLEPRPADTPGAAEAGLLPSAYAATVAPSRAAPGSLRRADFRDENPSDAARLIADWAVHSGDPAGAAFAIVDKREAHLYVFDPRGRLQGAAPVLLGLASGDHSVPGIGERALADIRPEERTTPAGRFVAEPGVNLDGEDIVWLDYDAAVSLHRVRATKPAERRLQRLASATVLDNRISYGCINLPAAFYDEVLSPALAAAGGIVYVLPETQPARALFGAYDVDTLAAARAAATSARLTGR